MTPAQMRMARAATGLTVRDLAKLASTATATIVRFEKEHGGAQANTLDRLQRVLEDRGCVFVAGDAPGVMYAGERVTDAG